MTQPVKPRSSRSALRSNFAAHHGRQRQRDDAGNRHRSRERERKFAKQRARQAALQTDGRVNRRERDRHGDDRPDQLARPDQRGLEWRAPFAQMAFDVFNHHDRVVHDQSDRQHDRQQREQVEREPERLHQKDAADQRNRNGHDRHEHRPERTEEKKDDDHDDQQRIGERADHFVDGVADVFGSVVADAGFETLGQIFLESPPTPRGCA